MNLIRANGLRIGYFLKLLVSCKSEIRGAQCLESFHEDGVMSKLQLLIIDPQNDFCDIPGATLPVPGAQADLQRLAALVARLDGAIEAIHVTLDSHHPVDIAHPSWWQDAQGESPKPFTMISVADVESGTWRARDEMQQAHSLAYVQQLACQGRYQLVVWPEHCLIGGWGQAVHLELAHALNHWARSNLKQVHYINKGINPGTEHYSAVKAEVPDTQDISTVLNQDLLDGLATADTILIAGEALSHCVASTVRDLAASMPALLGKLVLLTDCTSPVSGFAELGQTFIDELCAQGMRVATSQDF